MRVSVELEVFGSTLAELVQNATDEWREFVESDEATLPHDTEIHVEPSASNDYKATVYARVKVENDEGN